MPTCIVMNEHNSIRIKIFRVVRNILLLICILLKQNSLINSILNEVPSVIRHVMYIKLTINCDHFVANEIFIKEIKSRKTKRKLTPLHQACTFYNPSIELELEIDQVNVHQVAVTNVATLHKPNYE